MHSKLKQDFKKNTNTDSLNSTYLRTTLGTCGTHRKGKDAIHLLTERFPAGFGTPRPGRLGPRPVFSPGGYALYGGTVRAGV